MKATLIVGLMALTLVACRREVPYEPIRGDVDYDRYYNSGETYYPPRYPIK